MGRHGDRSTAVVGGLGPFEPSLIGIKEAEELPQGLYGSARASALMAIDRRFYSDALIVADLSNDATTRRTPRSEVLHETFGPRVIGLQISRNGDGMNPERRPVKHGAVLVYTVGRSYPPELYHSQLQSHQVRIVDGQTTRRAYEPLMGLETEVRESGIVYSCPPGQHDDLGMHAPCWPARTVAQGVESSADLLAVHEMGFHLAQGSLLAPPMTADKLVRAILGRPLTMP